MVFTRASQTTKARSLRGTNSCFLFTVLKEEHHGDTSFFIQNPPVKMSLQHVIITKLSTSFLLLILVVLIIIWLDSRWGGNRVCSPKRFGLWPAAIFKGSILLCFSAKEVQSEGTWTCFFVSKFLLRRILHRQMPIREF